MKKNEVKQIRIAVIDFDKCNPKKCALECIKACPINRQGKECIIIDETKNKAVINEELCIGCHLCYRCPFNAITIVNLTAKLTNEIHRFSRNSFRLYSLPLPVKGSIVGIIGPNGIGKTTAIKILSGKIIPNLGFFNEKPKDYKKVIEFFKGKELQAFFEKIEKEKIKFALKPQDITLISKFEGKTIKLLEMFGSKEKINELNEKIVLGNALNNKVKELSGGELQKVAIMIALLKEAEYYFFDEPTSYLDIKERFRIASLIQEIKNNDKSVLLVEHDLTVLDYLSDFIHVAFGKKQAYGVISGIKSTRNGINEFLEGYLKEENIRFREKELIFNVRPPIEKTKKEILIEYPEMQKKFENFNLFVESSALRKGEVIGVLGANAIGKTTFVKMLANVLEPDNIKLNWKLKVSYKPQYLEATEEIKVKELIEREINDLTLFENEIERRLNLKELNEKEISKLSGGELQKVAISIALSRNADLILLDEPTAFLDVEERLNVAAAIKAVTNIKGITSIVVDHDILFQDHVSDRLIIFEGKPSIEGKALKVMEMQEGMNYFLKEMNITFRRDKQTGRPRINKKGSVLDEEQKSKGQYYYIE